MKCSNRYLFTEATLRFLALILLGCVAALAQTPTVTAVLNGASLDTHLWPGVAAVILGTNFGSSTAGVSISVGGKPGYVVVVGPSRMEAQLPFDVATGSTFITVTVGSATSPIYIITLDPFAPALFTVNGNGSGSGFIFGLLDGTYPFAPARAGDILVAIATGLRPTSPATPIGPPPKDFARTATFPMLTVGGVRFFRGKAGTWTTGPGFYQVIFTPPAGIEGDVPVVLSSGGKDSNRVTLSVFGISAIVSNASFRPSGTAVAGSIVSLFGNGFGTKNQSAGFPGTVFQGVSVNFNGMPAPLFALTATQSQIDLLVPSELPASGTVDVTVSTPFGTSPPYKLTMTAAVPGLYFLADPSTKNRFNAIVQFNGTAWLAMPASMAAALKFPGNCSASNYDPASFCAQPAAPGDFLALYTTALAKATPNATPTRAPLKPGPVSPATPPS